MRAGGAGEDRTPREGGRRRQERYRSSQGAEEGEGAGLQGMHNTNHMNVMVADLSRSRPRCLTIIWSSVSDAPAAGASLCVIVIATCCCCSACRRAAWEALPFVLLLSHSYTAPATGASRSGSA